MWQEIKPFLSDLGVKTEELSGEEGRIKVFVGATGYMSSKGVTTHVRLRRSGSRKTHRGSVKLRARWPTMSWSA
jgi:hypothetical protein